MMRGELDMLYEVSRDAIEFLEVRPRSSSTPSPRTYYIPLVFNMRHPILSRVDVRQAMNEGIDQEALVREGLRGQGPARRGSNLARTLGQQHRARPGRSILRPPSSGSTPRIEGECGERLARCRAGSRSHCLGVGRRPRFERLALVLQKQLADIGIDMRLEPLGRAWHWHEGPEAATLTRSSSRWPAGSLSWVYDFWHSHESAESIRAIAAADAVAGPDPRRADEEDPRRRGRSRPACLHDDPPARSWHGRSSRGPCSTKFDVAAEPDRDILSNLWQWRPAGPPKQASR